MTDSHCCAAETKATLSNNFPPLKKLERSILFIMLKKRERELAGSTSPGPACCFGRAQMELLESPPCTMRVPCRHVGSPRPPPPTHERAFCHWSRWANPNSPWKLDWRANGARIQMLLPRPPVNEKPLWFQQPALRCDHRASADVPGSEDQTGGLHRAPEKSHRPSPEFHHLLPRSAAVSRIRGSFIFHCWKFLKCHIK